MPGGLPVLSGPSQPKKEPKRHLSDDGVGERSMLLRMGQAQGSLANGTSPERQRPPGTGRGRHRTTGSNCNEPKDDVGLFHTLSIMIRLLFVVCVINTCWMATVSFGPTTGGIPKTSRVLQPFFSPSDTSAENRFMLTDQVLDDDSSVMVVLVSNRLDGIIATVSSILVHTQSRGVDLVIIGDSNINEVARKRFVQKQGNRTRVLHTFTSLTVENVETDLVAQGHVPIWRWSEWHSSLQEEDWYRPNSTLHVADWDHLATHAHKLNHLRFYLPYVSLFRNRSYIFFVDDDILIRKDLGVIASETLPSLHPRKSIVTPCNIWKWDTTCQRFEFLNETTIGSILEMPSLYGDRKICQSESETHCYPATYLDFLRRVLPPPTADTPHPEKEPAWNFGFSLFHLDNWKREDLTARYESVMRASYAEHVFPETSLSFGLGVAYLAFAGSVECWNDFKVRVRDGFGFIEHSRFEKSFGPDFLQKVDVIHYTGPIKPWKEKTTIETSSLEPWLDVLTNENYFIPEQLQNTPSTEIFIVLGGERTGTQWLMDAIDQHPSICAGENGMPETGFSPDSLMPVKLSWLPLCSTRRSCSFEFIYSSVLDLQATMDPRGRYALYPARCQQQNVNRDPFGENLPRICNFLKALNGNFSDAAIEDLWIDAFRREDSRLIGCSCPRGTKLKGLKVLSEWMVSDDRPNALTLNSLRNTKVVRLRRSNLVDRFISQEVASKTGIYKVTTQSEHLDQMQKLGSKSPLQLSTSTMIATISKWKKDDENADRWAELNGSEVLELDFEDCMVNPGECIERVCRFLNVSAGELPATTNTRTVRRGGLVSYKNFIANKEEIKNELSNNSAFAEYVGDWVV